MTFFNNNSSCKCNSFSPMSTRKTYFIRYETRQGTRRLNWLGTRWPDWERNERVRNDCGYETTGYKTTVDTKELLTGVLTKISRKEPPTWLYVAAPQNLILISLLWTIISYLKQYLDIRIFLRYGLKFCHRTPHWPFFVGFAFTFKASQLTKLLTLAEGTLKKAKQSMHRCSLLVLLV